MLGIGFVCLLGELCWAVRLSVFCVTYVGNWVCLFVCWVNYVRLCVCLFLCVSNVGNWVFVCLLGG